MKKTSVLRKLAFVTFVCTMPTATFAIGDFGPDTCAEGFVWREACGPNDHVCVTPDIRSQAQQDNQDANKRRQPGGGPYGPDTCLQGFVWREACGPQDHVCVPVSTRARAAEDNRHAGQRLKYPIAQGAKPAVINIRDDNQAPSQTGDQANTEIPKIPQTNGTCYALGGPVKTVITTYYGIFGISTDSADVLRHSFYWENGVKKQRWESLYHSNSPLTNVSSIHVDSGTLYHVRNNMEAYAHQLESTSDCPPGYSVERCAKLQANGGWELMGRVPLIGLATAQCARNGFFSLSPDVSNPQIMRYHVMNQTWMTVGNFNGMIHSGCYSIYTTSLAGDNIQKYNGYDWSGQWTNIPGSFRSVADDAPESNVYALPTSGQTGVNMYRFGQWSQIYSGAADKLTAANWYVFFVDPSNDRAAFLFRGKTYSFLDFPVRSITMNPYWASKTIVVGRDDNVVYSCFPAPTTPRS